MTKYLTPLGVIVMVNIPLTLLVVGIVWLTYAGLDNLERIECQHWSSQNGQYAGFWAAQWQIDQCAQHDIELPPKPPDEKS